MLNNKRQLLKCCHIFVEDRPETIATGEQKEEPKQPKVLMAPEAEINEAENAEEEEATVEVRQREVRQRKFLGNPLQTWPKL